MELVCASICYRGYAEDEVAATLEHAPALGYRLMEIHGPLVWSAEAVEQFDLSRVQALLPASGMRCAGIYSPGWGGTDAADVERRARAIARCVQLTALLGGDRVTSSGAEKHAVPGALDRVLACTRRVLELIPADGPVRLCLEPHFGNALQDAEDFRHVLNQVPDRRLGVCLDTGHFHTADVDMVAFTHEFARRLYNVHLKDHRGPVSVGIGRGEIDLPLLFQALRAVGYAGDLTVELEVQDPQNLPRYTQEAYVYLSGMLGRKL